MSLLRAGAGRAGPRAGPVAFAAALVAVALSFSVAFSLQPTALVALPGDPLAGWTHLPLAILFLALAVPAAAMSAYLARLRRIQALTVWSSDSVAMTWLSGPFTSICLGACVAVSGAAMLALRAPGFGSLDWLLVAAAPLVFAAVRAATRRRVSAQFQPAFRTGRVLWVASVVSALVLAGADLVLRLHTGGFEIAAGPAAAGGAFGGSALIGFFAHLGALASTVESHALAFLTRQGGGLGALAIVLLANGAFYLFLALSFAAFCVPAREYARILASPVASAVPPPVAPGRRRRTAVLLACALAGYLPAVHGAELFLRASHDLRAAPERARVAVEAIGDVLVREGTLAQIEEARSRAIVAREAISAPLATSLEAAFDAMRGNVDVYLDWYYSLPAEYARLLSLVAGNAEDLLDRKIMESLGAGDPFGAFQADLREADAADAAILAGYHETMRALVEANRVEPVEGGDIHVIAALDPVEALRLPEPLDGTGTARRFGIGVASGGVAGLVSAVVVRRAAIRLATSGGRLLAVRALQATAARTVGGFGGALAGATAGGAAGSLVPGIGTAIGAAAGFMVAIGIGVGTDYLFLRLEEALSRERHRETIFAAIAAAEAEMRRGLGLRQP